MKKMIKRKAMSAIDEVGMDESAEDRRSSFIESLHGSGVIDGTIVGRARAGDRRRDESVRGSNRNAKLGTQPRPSGRWAGEVAGAHYPAAESPAFLGGAPGELGCVSAARGRGTAGRTSLPIFMTDFQKLITALAEGGVEVVVDVAYSRSPENTSVIPAVA
ncbi:MAG TPA: hypothetical protein VD788_08330 [Candidatus Polarisedimenticolaceae bacterium]|nr:hypothetical protein [Candidatus Polarisedimenticolaceae bacterium]